MAQHLQSSWRRLNERGATTDRFRSFLPARRSLDGVVGPREVSARGWPRTYFVAGSPLIKLRVVAAWGLLVIGAACFVMRLYGLFRSN
jgi:hypothetical protein